MYILLLIILNRSLCPNVMLIVGQWCSTLCTEAKETLDSVPIWLLRCFVPVAVASDPGVFRFIYPSFTPPSHTRPPPPLPPPSPFLLPGQFPPVHTTASLTMPPASSPPPCTGLECVASQYTAQLYSTFTRCRFPSDQTPPPLSPPLWRCTLAFFHTSDVASALSVAAPPGLGNPLGPVLCGG